ncbi:SGNH/GDSL hydrolase family protein [Bacillus massilinigeriensis]|uniref:SGNH/GDSL hydrolase family protein n=1 Tax=Bacillus mediterraneensis TaxID=1805474 RepID=UPI0008F82CE8|nr:SGNH/GDSL hydrolase family protein [Bacillus mediterraneensis]
MKKLSIVLLFIICISTLILGTMEWKQKTNSSSIPAASKKVGSKAVSTIDSDALVNYAANWPQPALDGFSKSLKTKKPFVILLAGSPALGKEEGWASSVSKNLKETYESAVVVETREYDMTSSEFLSQNKADELASLKPDMTILEPLTLKDNGIVRIEESHSNIDAIREKLQEANPGSTLILQPPNPLFDASYYPFQVEALKKYATENNIPYIDHWAAWPEMKNEELKEYIEEDGSLPSSEGHKLWAQYLTDYLISK